jgi:hypothetical protein
MISKTKLALAIAIALGLAAPFTTSAFAESTYGDWGYWSANDSDTAQASKAQASSYDPRTAFGSARTSTVSHPAKKIGPR